MEGLRAALTAGTRRSEALLPSLRLHGVSSHLMSALILQLLKSGHYRRMPDFVEKINDLAFVIPEKIENILTDSSLYFSFPVYKPVSDWLCLDTGWELHDA